MRAREVVALLVVIAVVAGGGYLGWRWFLQRTDPAAEEADDQGAEQVARAYAAAWSDGDPAAMLELVRGDPPDDLVDHLAQLEDALAPSARRIEVAGVQHPEDGRAVARLAVELETPAIPEPLTWEAPLELLRDRGRWQVRWSLSAIHPELRPTWRFATDVEPVAREPILDRDGRPLASDDARVIGFVPDGVDDPDALADTVDRVLPGTGAQVRSLFSGELQDDWFYPLATVSTPRAETAWQRLRGTPGIVEPRTPPEDERRALLDIDLARHLVGVVEEATAEQLEELRDAGQEAPVGTRVPQFGLEAALDERLTGSDRLLVGLREGDTGPLQVVIGEAQEDPSAPVETTLDALVQRAVENVLGEVEQPAAIVVVDGRDGGIVASASRPLSGWDRARQGRYPPGSTMKLVTLEAALAEGGSLDDQVDCPAETTVGGLRISNAGDPPSGPTLAAAFAASCNTTFASLAAELGSEAWLEAAERFGLDTAPMLPLDVAEPSVPVPQDTAELAAASFGQARVELSPLHVAAMVAAVAEGTWHRPHLLAEDTGGDSRALQADPEDLRAALRLAVTDGTGHAAAVDGVEVAGKTGTAEHAGDDHAWFAGLLDHLGVAILLEEGGSGSEAAAPLMALLASELQRLEEHGLEPTDPLAAIPGAVPGSTDEDDPDR